MQHTRTYPVHCGVLVRRHFIHDLIRVELARPSVHKITESPSPQSSGTHRQTTERTLAASLRQS